MIYHNGIPVIDIGALSSAKSIHDLKDLAQCFYHVYAEIGFAYLTNHGISSLLIENVFKQSRLFHNLPEKEKLMIKQNQFFRGYVPHASSVINSSTLGKAIIPNQSSAFILGHEVSENDADFKKGINLAGENQWPNASLLPVFKKTLLHYRDSLTVLLKNISRVFSLCLTKNFYALDHYFQSPTTFLRLQYYPPQPKIIPEQQYGSAPHTDYGVLTLLAQDLVGGLQVKHANGSWLNVDPLQGAFILNTGDMMRNISNNKLLSTPHRVLNTSGKKRYSVPFFFDPNMHAVISPCISNGEKILYKPIEYYHHLMERIKSNYNIGAR